MTDDSPSQPSGPQPGPGPRPGQAPSSSGAPSPAGQSGADPAAASPPTSEPPPAAEPAPEPRVAPPSEPPSEPPSGGPSYGEAPPPGGPVYGSQPHRAPGYGPPGAFGGYGQPTAAPGYGQQPPSAPGYGQQPPSAPGYGQQPPSTPGYGQQPPGGPAFGYRPVSGPVHGQAPPQGVPGFGQAPGPAYGPAYGQAPPQDGPAYGQPRYGTGQPQYGPEPSGYGPGPSGYAPGQPAYGGAAQFGARPDPKLVKPPLWWIGAGWVVAVVCVVAGVVLFMTGVRGTVGDVAPTRTFAAGESVTVALDPAERPAVYIDSPTRVHYQCMISGGPGQARLVNTAANQTITQGSTRWQLILLVNAPSAGDYRLTCATQEAADARFGVGRDPAGAAGGLAGGVAALLILPGAGILVGIVVTAVVLVRRSRSRRRLAMGG